METLFVIACVVISLHTSHGRTLYGFEHATEGNSSAIQYKRAAKCGRGLNLRSGTITWITLPTTDVNGTAIYDKHLECRWTISAPKGNYVMLKSEYFFLEYSRDCSWDYVRIDEGDGGKNFCGVDPVVYISYGDYVKILFKSDESFGHHGFKFEIKIIAKDSISASRCNSAIVEGPPGIIYNNEDEGSDCFYRIQAPFGSVVELNMKKSITFGSNTCEQESVDIYRGYSIQGVLYQLCSDAVQGVIPLRDEVLFIHYNNQVGSEGERFELEYSFVEDNFTPPPPAPTTPSPVGGDNDCSMLVKHESDGFVYTAPEYQNNRNCIVVVRNTQLLHHVVQVHFTRFEMEQSNNCNYDYVKVMTGEREDSPQIGGRYCGTSLQGRTFVTSGNSLRLEFKTDESLAFYGFQAKISFVPSGVCDHCKGREVCVTRGYEKLCTEGKECETDCQNGGTCVRSRSEQQCYCPTGFSGANCSTVEEQDEGALKFVIVPRRRNLRKGSDYNEECKATAPNVDENDIKYQWTFDGELIGDYNEKTGSGTHPGGLLQISDFSEKWEGLYSCLASTATSEAEHTFEYRLVENCDIGIRGPKPMTKKVGQQALFHCHSSKAVSKVWKKDGHLLYDGEHLIVNDERYRILTNGYLELSHVTESDAGTYRCEVESALKCFTYREAELTVLNIKERYQYCGLSVFDEAEQATSRLSKGYKARTKSNPWHVIIRTNFKDGRQNKGFCGGSLISTKYVLTAAHCIAEFEKHFHESLNQNNARLIFGSTDCTGQTKNLVERSPADYIMHEDYTNSYKGNDIALIELDRPVKYTDAIRPICLESLDFNKAEFFSKKVSSGKVVGCGQITGLSHSYPTLLQEVFVPYVSREQCGKSLDHTKYTVTETMICFGSKVARTGDACSGDSGSSVVMANDHQWVQTGIVSWGMGCDKKDHYGIYTNVGYFYDWIRKKTKFDEEESYNFLDN